VIDAAQGEEEKLQEEIISNMANEVYSDVLRYADREQLNRDRQRCQIRMTTKDQSDTMYRDVRNKKMNA
jgi:phage gp16-like protein